MLGTALYYPHIDIHDVNWLKSAVLFWDQIQTIVPTAIQYPYRNADTKICEQEGYLQPLRCDLHQDILDELGKRVLNLIQEPEWVRVIAGGEFGGPSREALIAAGKMGIGVRSWLREMTSIHPSKMTAEFRALFGRSDRRTRLSTGKVSSNFTEIVGEGDLFGMRPEKLSSDQRARNSRWAHGEGDWLLVDGRFAAIYMASLAALLARDIDVSPLTDEESYSGVNLRCLIDDVAASGPAAARGALVSVVMRGIRVDPETPIQRLLTFRRDRRVQLAELSGKFDSLRSLVQNSESRLDIEKRAQRVFENEVEPALERLKRELRDQSIASAWDGFQTAATFSAAPSVALWATGISAPIALGAAAFISVAGIGIKSYLARSKARSASPYTYLLDIGRKFSLPR